MKQALLLGLVLLAGCAAEKPDGPVAFSIGSDLRPLKGRTVVVQGWILELHQKGQPRLYQKDVDRENFVALAAEDRRLEPFLKHRVEVVGTVVDVGIPKDGPPAQGYETGTLGIRVESIRDAR